MFYSEDAMEVKTLKDIRCKDEEIIYSEKLLYLPPNTISKYNGVNFKVIACILNNILKWDVAQEIDIKTNDVLSYKVITPDRKFFIDINGVYNIEEYLSKYSSKSLDNSSSLLQTDRKFIPYSCDNIPEQQYDEMKIAYHICNKLNLPWYYKWRSVSLMRKKEIEEIQFNFPDDIQIQFQYGDCGLLALSLYYKLRWDIYALYFLPNNFDMNSKNRKDIIKKYEASHYINLVPTTAHIQKMYYEEQLNFVKFVDITGISSFTNIISYWKEMNKDDIKNQKIVLIKVTDQYVIDHNCSLNIMSEHIIDNEHDLYTQLETELTKIDDISTELIQKMNLKDHYFIRKVIEVTDSPLYAYLGELLKSNNNDDINIAKTELQSNFFDPDNYYNRLIRNYTLAYQLGIGPQVSFNKQYDKHKEILIIYMEYLPIQNNKITYKKCDYIINSSEGISNKVTDLTSTLHKHNMFHGDFNIGNIAFTDKEEPKLIDFDLTFTFDEAETMILFLHWMKEYFYVDDIPGMISVELRNLYEQFGDAIIEA